MAEPSVRPTSLWWLAVTAAVGALAATVLKLLFDATSGSAPSPGPAAVWIFALAVLTALGAVLARRTIHVDALRVDPRLAVRWLTFAKTAGFVGALFAGFFAAYAAASFAHRDTLAGQPRFWWSIAAAVASVVWLGAGLVLERFCRVPRSDDDEDEPPAVA